MGFLVPDVTSPHREIRETMHILKHGTYNVSGRPSKQKEPDALLSFQTYPRWFQGGRRMRLLSSISNITHLLSI